MIGKEVLQGWLEFKLDDWRMKLDVRLIPKIRRNLKNRNESGNFKWKKFYEKEDLTLA